MFLDAAALRRIFAWQNPFREREERRHPAAPWPVTILGANANFPFEMQVRAFCRAAADGPGSPLVVQFSHAALRTAAGRHPRGVPAAARLGRLVLEDAVEESGARLVAVALDHFRVPAYPGPGQPSSARSLRRARAAVDDAYEAARPVVGGVEAADLEAYAAYLASPECRQFLRSFLEAVDALGAAWAMIDTERLPPVLDFALTREVVETVREVRGLDVMLEAEYGATGVAGQARAYEPLHGSELRAFAEEVACFVRYTGADAISYPIGMEHGAPLAERHEPDEERLAVVQRRVDEVAGRYVPFVQHGGTGAARLVRGLVGKNNVNTRFLVAAANRFADRIQADLERIRAGVKEACGSGLYLGVVEAVYAETLKCLREAGTYGTGPELAEVLGL
ncbi:MAG: class II fructose-bisphosphate aldolase [Firmicutes bacterium]|nr:class II fructose-bisphosphate aldolase [Bacillota bacterium]